MRKKKSLLIKTHWLLPLASLVMLIYGLASLLMSRWLSAQAIRGGISVGTYQAKLARFYSVSGILASLLLIDNNNYKSGSCRHYKHLSAAGIHNSM